MKKSKVEFKTKLPTPKQLGASNLIVYDRFFDQVLPELEPIQTWLKSFPFRIGFDSGEPLKDLNQFPEKIEKILDIVSQMAIKNVQIVSVGGGSLGDFAGFVASILKRGLPLVHIPTTWLSAMDSSHGGKTALNVGGYKNQVGSFYPADRVLLVKPILFLQPEARSSEAYGEAIKMALLTGGTFWSDFSKIKKFDNKTAWKYLPQLIRGKYKIVSQDPFEKKGIRHLLNLGHTFGHVWEASQNLAHGIAVAYGIRAALEFSKDMKILSPADYARLNAAPAVGLLPSHAALCALVAITHNPEQYLLRDKKISKRKTLRFIFIKRAGQCPIADVTIENLIHFYSKLKIGENK